MKDQINTIREALETCVVWGNAARDKNEQALAALAQIEAAVGKPVAWLDEEYDTAYTSKELDGGNVDGLLPLYAAPVAQQPQAEAVPTVQIVNCKTCKHSGKSCDDYPCRNCGVEFGDGPFNRWEAPQQAEAVPPTHVLVPVEPDEMWAYQVIRHHQPDLEVGGTAWLECLKEMLHWHAAIAQQKGGVA